MVTELKKLKLFESGHEGPSSIDDIIQMTLTDALKVTIKSPEIKSLEEHQRENVLRYVTGKGVKL